MNQDLTVIVSSFMPFQGRATNPSQIVARRFAEELKQIGCRAPVEITLKVVWDEDQRTIRRHIARAAARRPGTRIEWIAFGQGSDRFQMETTARNAREPVADNKNQIPGTLSLPAGKSVPLRNQEDGPAELHADPADARKIMTALDMSESPGAGQFLCESVLYELLYQSKSRAPANLLDTGRFFHIPFEPADSEINEFVRKLARLLFIVPRPARPDEPPSLQW
jgi:pyrrolidone-carboxylate peptidase